MSGYQASKRITINLMSSAKYVFLLKTSSFANESYKILEQSDNLNYNFDKAIKLSANVW